MKKMTSNEIRNTWLNFFKSKNHHVEAGASLIPVNDPTLLWVNAGVAALKKYFDGTIIPENPRICNVQKAIRTNDIENVGHTARHHTFFEMLGNFSIGDYFRKEAIDYACEILFDERYFGFDKDKIYITYHPTDKETYQCWLNHGISVDHLIALEDNFWEIGEGPCGPDTEMYYDRGIQYDPQKKGIQLLKEDIENDRYIEIWNIVFSQYQAKAGQKREEYQELPHKNIDTGAGLERFACILQDAPTNYETDLFLPIIRRCETLAKVKYEGNWQTSFKIIADHLRTCTFALADGASFSNEGRGYVLRRLLRRAVRHGKKLGIENEFLALLVDEVIAIMKDFYPYLLEKADYIKDLISQEERKFGQTLEDGEKKLDELYQKKHAISGEDAFVLYDTYGFPFELTLEYAAEKNLTIDHDAFLKAMEKQKEMARSRRHKANSMGSQNAQWMDFMQESEFVGYTQDCIESEVIKIFKNENELLVVTKKTPFYAEMGGEIGDTGLIYNAQFKGSVVDTLTLPQGQHLHKVKVTSGILNEHDIVTLKIDLQKRNQIQANHSATHLLHQALKDVLGNHVQQQGSMVSDRNLRFDFNHYQPISNDELLQIETLVKEKIQQALPVNIYHTTLNEAKAKKITALFNEKYKDDVRVVDMGYSKELCGGCHVKNTREIIDFAILSIESKGSGIYRIEALTGNDLIEKIKQWNPILIQEYTTTIQRFHNLKETLEKNTKSTHFKEFDLKICPSYAMLLSYRQSIEGYKEQIKNMDKMFKEISQQNALNQLADESQNIIDIHQTRLLIKKVDAADINVMKSIADRLVDRYQDLLVVLVYSNPDQVLFVAKTSKNYVDRGIHCGRIVKEAALICQGNGGGRPDMAQAGGKDATKVDEAITKIKELLA